ncbi:MAG TPA: ABC transporter ATP-binding protein, partial [Candidatus Latescibacteria bacterium]|nr:ABC transporter ATP-binding protein [Candidatus Latescibacterota bacterium]
RPYRKKIFRAILLTATLTLMGLVPPLVIKWFIDEVVGASRWDLLNGLILVLVAVPVVSGAVSFLNNYTIAYIGQRLAFDIRLAMYRHLQRLSLRFYDRMKTGKIMSRIMSDATMIQNMVTQNTITMVTDSISFLFALVIIFLLSWKLSILLLCLLPLYVLNYRFFIRKIRDTNISYRFTMDQITNTLHERIKGTRLVKSYVKEEAETDRFLNDTRQSLNYAMRGMIFSTSFSTASRIINGVGSSIIFCVGCYFVIRGEMTYGAVTAFMSYALRLLTPALRFTEISNLIQQTLVSADRIFEVLDAEPEVKEVQGAKPLPPIKGHVKFEDVSFEYVPGEPVLKGIDFEVQPGTTVAFVGHTGCGKTTIGNLLLRLYDLKSGRILIDGHDIAKVTLKSLRSQIGVVLQDTILFNSSIKENIRYGKRRTSDQEVIEAAKIAEIHDFIVDLPHGYDTIVGEGGTQLSVGQKQRIAIARAILTDPGILILDEATSSLDPQSEALIQKALDKVLAGRTSFVIAHRLSTIVNAALIIVMDRGKIIEKGTHMELMKNRDGLYRQLYKQQFLALQAA